MFEAESRLEDERWNERLDEEVRRLNSEAAQSEQASPAEAAAPPTTWPEACEHMVATLDAEAHARG